jgi:hypothetical protein
MNTLDPIDTITGSVTEKEANHRALVVSLTAYSRQRVKEEVSR